MVVYRTKMICWHDKVESVDDNGEDRLKINI